MSRSPFLIALVALSVTACGPAGHTGEKPMLMVSVPPQAEIAEAIAGDGFDVQVMLARGANPETFDPSTSERMSVEHADIFFKTGVLPFEATLEQSASATTFADTSKGVNLLYGTHGHSHDNGHTHSVDAPDPHYWSSVEGVRSIARNMAMSLKNTYPGKADEFEHNLAKYEQHLDSIDALYKSSIAKAPSKSFAVWHPSLSYFARDYGLEQIPLGEEGKEMSAKSIKEAIDHAKGENVKVFFFQKEYDSRQAGTISDGIGSRLVEINPLDKNWEQQLKLVCDELSRP